MPETLPFNYHHLYYFWVTARAGSIAEGRRRLLLSQSALSAQIRLLERSFDARLLSRGRRGVSLTSEGRVAFDYCERIFSQGAELAAALRPDAGAPRVRIRLGVAGSISRRVVTQVLAGIRAVDRGVRVSIVGGAAGDIRERLEKHRLDIAVSSTDLSAGMGVEFRARLVASIPLHFVAAPKLARLIRRFPADLARVPMLLRGPENPVRKDVDLFLCRHGVEASVEAEIEDGELIRSLALSGEGAAALDALTAGEELARGRLERLNPGSLGVSERIWFISGRHPKPNPALQRVMRHLMDSFRVRSAVR